MASHYATRRCHCNTQRACVFKRRREIALVMAMLTFLAVFVCDVAALIGISDADVMDPFVKAPQALIMDQIRKIHVPHFSELGDRIKIPLDTRLLDALHDYESASQWNRHIFEKKRLRRFEIETHAETTNSVATVQVQEVKNMGITSKTTYNFNSRQFDSGKIDFSILASYHSKEQDMTILSVNKSTGRVRGIHREASSGKARNVGNDDDGRLRMRLLQEVRDRREWTCGAVGHGHERCWR
eukprot:CCRYP_009447-RA/>CCRYP_009447-RA protein AED:0.00 eAED:0.00 QI:44/1/1/1/0/0/2/93/240